MNDLAMWDVGGGVHTLRIEHVEWDSGLEQWSLSR